MVIAKSIRNSPAGPSRRFVPFSVDAALLRELGERLVGKPEVALAELAKNSYDADATLVTIRFAADSIEIVDNGTGMDDAGFANYWMRVGTTHKQSEPRSALGRTVTGSKGVGRLSVQFLGGKVEVVSRTGPRKEAIHATVDWKKARQKGELIEAGAELSVADPALTSERLPRGSSGTSIRITGLQQEWGSDAIRGLARELWFLNPPPQLQGNVSPVQDFKVNVEGLDDEDKRAFELQLDQALESWIAIIEGSLRGGRAGKLAKVVVTFRDGQRFEQSYSLPNRKLQEATFQIRVYKLTGKQAGNVSVYDARRYFHSFGGVHIYDDGFRLPFYGGGDEDWLGLEVAHSHRLTISRLLPENLQVPNAMNDLPTNSRIFGLAQVSTSSERRSAPDVDVEKGRYLNVQITRDRLIDNSAFTDLQHLVRWGLDFYASRSSFRKQSSIAVDYLPPPDASPLLLDVRGRLENLRRDIPEAARAVSRIEKSLEVFLETETQRQDTLAQERILLGALATAGMGAVAVEHELGKELLVLSETLEKIIKRSPIAGDEDLSDLLTDIRNWMRRVDATQKLFSPLMEQSEREEARPLKVKKVLSIVSKNSQPLMRGVSIDTSAVDSEIIFPKAPLTAWQAIFQNVLVNAVNAMIETGGKRIFCRTVMEDSSSRISLIIEDEGVGVELANSQELFKPFVRRLKLSEDRKALGLGGVGLGLTIVRMVAESVNCRVSFVRPSTGFNTAFKISWTTDK